MEHIIVINGFEIQKSGKKYEYAVNVLGQGKFSMTCSDDSIKKELDMAKQGSQEDVYFTSLKNVCIKILKHNDFFFDDIEIISLG